MGLSGPTVAQCDDVFPPQDIFAPRQFQHEHLVEAGDSGEVERVDALHRREPGGTDPTLDRSALPVDQFQFDEAKQVAAMIDTVARAFPGQLLIFAQHRGKLELLEMMREQNLRRACRGAGGHFVFARPAHAAIPGMSAA